MAGTIDFIPVEPFSSVGPLRASCRTRHRGSHCAGRHRQQGRFSRARCSSRCRRSRSNGRSARSSARAVGTTDFSYDDLLSVCGGGKFERLSPSLPDRFGRRLPRRNLRHQGIADLAVDGLRLRRDRDPARRRGHPPRRNRRGAVRGHRGLGQPGRPGALLAAVGAVDPERSAAGGLKAVLQEPRRLRHGRGRRRPGAGEL